jgi:hypothetical protein
MVAMTSTATSGASQMKNEQNLTKQSTENTKCADKIKVTTYRIFINKSLESTMSTCTLSHQQGKPHNSQ